MNGHEVPTAVLMHWYVCGRKMVCATETIAHLYAPEKHAYRCPHGNHWHVGRRPVRSWRNHDQRKTQLVNARKAWDQQAYKHLPKTCAAASESRLSDDARQPGSTPAGVAVQHSNCAYDPPCPMPVLDVMVPLNPRMGNRPACERHAMPQVNPWLWEAS